MDSNKKKHRFLEAFGIVVMVLALIRCGLDGFNHSSDDNMTAAADSTAVAEPTAEQQEAADKARHAGYRRASARTASRACPVTTKPSLTATMCNSGPPPIGACSP